MQRDKNWAHYGWLQTCKIKQSSRSLLQQSWSHRQVQSKEEKKKANTFCQKPIKLSCTFSVFLIPSVLINMIFLSKHKLSSLGSSSPSHPPFHHAKTARDDTILLIVGIKRIFKEPWSPLIHPAQGHSTSSTQPLHPGWGCSPAPHDLLVRQQPPPREERRKDCSFIEFIVMTWHTNVPSDGRIYKVSVLSALRDLPRTPGNHVGCMEMYWYWGDSRVPSKLYL